ncbi:hypothetical protein ACHWQZ_G000095 [Mnemiopsis leidyi]
MNLLVSLQDDPACRSFIPLLTSTPNDSDEDLFRGTNSPPSHSPPVQSPPTNSPPTHSPPTHSTPTHSPPTHSPPTHSTPTNSPPSHSPPSHSPPTNSPPTYSPPLAKSSKLSSSQPPKTIKIKNARGRNFSAEEIETVMRQAGKHSRLLKGRFQPGVTNELKKSTWENITEEVNRVNGVGDRSWQTIRKKWQDVSCAARKKYRAIASEQRKTGGGVSKAPSLTTLEEVALDSVPKTALEGIVGGVDATSSSSSTVTCSMKKSAKLIRKSVSMCEDLSEISFDTISPRISPETTSNDPVQQVMNIDSHREVDNMNLIKSLPPVKSRRTVTKDLRNKEFKTILSGQNKMNELLEELIRIKKIKYRAQGLNVD